MSRETEVVERLKTAVADQRTVTASVDTLLTELFAAVRESGDVSPELEEVLQGFEAERQALIDSVTRNTLPAPPAA